jgi:hypothetical protein
MIAAVLGVVKMPMLAPTSTSQPIVGGSGAVAGDSARPTIPTTDSIPPIAVRVRAVRTVASRPDRGVATTIASAMTIPVNPASAAERPATICCWSTTSTVTPARPKDWKNAAP